MLDLLAFRAHEGGQPDEVRESQRRRGAAVGLVDAVIAADETWRQLKHKETAARKALAEAKRSLRPVRPAAAAEAEVDAAARPSRAEVAALSKAAADATAAEHTAQAQLQALLLRVGNLVHEEAPVARAPPLAPPDVHLALRRLVAAGLAEVTSPARRDGGSRDGGVAWRPTGAGLVLVHAWLAHALRLVAARGFTLLASPLEPTAERIHKLDRARRLAPNPCGPFEPRSLIHSSADH